MKWKLLESLPKRQSIHHIECDLNKFRNSNESLISWIGHATFLIKHNGLTILTDPHFSKRASPFQWIGPKRTTPPSAQVNHLPNIDIVLISHDHYDHLDKASVLKIHEQQKSNPPLFVLPLGLGKWFKNEVSITGLSWIGGNHIISMVGSSLQYRHSTLAAEVYGRTEPYGVAGLLALPQMTVSYTLPEIPVIRQILKPLAITLMDSMSLCCLLALMNHNGL